MEAWNQMIIISHLKAYHFANKRLFLKKNNYL